MRLLDYEALRFEDFLAQDRSGRQACLAGVDAADVYVLLLGPKYGEPFPDSGLSPTAEEFHRARQRGIPVLVFHKVTEEDDEPKQAEFKAEVGHYVKGRFWRSFTDPLSCNQAVGEALKELQLNVGPVRRETPPGPVTVPWLTDIHPSAPGAGGSRFGYDSRGGGLVPGSVYAPVLELHLVPVDSSARLSSRELESLEARMVRDARDAGFFPDSDQLHIRSGGGHAWAFRPPETTSPGTGPASWLHGRTVEHFRGLVADRAGAVGAFTSLVTDTMGALVNQQGLQSKLATLFGLVHPHLPDPCGAGSAVSLAAGLVHADRAWEGDPADVGGRTSGSLRTAQGASVRVGGDFVVPAGRLTQWFGDLGADLAHDIVADLNQLH